DRDHLLLDAGKRPPPRALALGEPREERVHALEVLFDARAVAALESAHLQILQDGHARKEPASLGGLRDAHLDDVVRGPPRDVPTLEVDLSLAGRVEPVDRAQRRRLAGSV